MKPWGCPNLGFIPRWALGMGHGALEKREAFLYSPHTPHTPLCSPASTSALNQLRQHKERDRLVHTQCVASDCILPPVRYGIKNQF